MTTEPPIRVEPTRTGEFAPVCDYCRYSGKPQRTEGVAEAALRAHKCAGSHRAAVRRAGLEAMPSCTCGHIACVCGILAAHVEGCKFRLAATCPVPIECDHGYDACPICDPCTCP